MKISLIIPILNEEKKINRIIENILDLDGECEVIFVDGGSVDETVSIIGNRFKVYKSEKGRAKQMNLGAKMSSGEALLFLHCDSILPKTALKDIIKVLSDGYRLGCFRTKFDSDNILMKCCGFMSDFRVKYRQIAFGDQGIFIYREDFDRLDGYKEISIMEDYQFSLDANKIYKIGQTNTKIITSSRRFL